MSTPWNKAWGAVAATFVAGLLGACGTADPGAGAGSAESGISNSTSFGGGDVFVSLKNSDVQWRRADGTLVKVLRSNVGGHAEGMGFDAAGTLFVTHWCTDGVCTAGNTVEKFDTSGRLLGTFGAAYYCNPNSIDFDEKGNAVVGQADCDADVWKLDSAGKLMAMYDVAVENRGSAWLDLMADNCTVAYTSHGANVMRYNICAQEQLPNFNNAPMPGGSAYAVRYLPDGSCLVANAEVITRLDKFGDLAGTYDVAAEPDLWFGVENAGDDKSFWTSNFGSDNIYRIDLATGAVLKSFSTGTGAFSTKAVAVSPPPPSQPKPPRGMRMTGGGSIFTDDGMRITHGFQLRCDVARVPHNLEINWHGSATTPKGRFHLETLTFAECTDDPTIEPDPPKAPFDTYRGAGSGRVNGVRGGRAEWVFTDAGEPGRADRIRELRIWDAAGNLVISIADPGKPLTFGNHQAHK